MKTKHTLFVVDSPKMALILDTYIKQNPKWQDSEISYLRTTYTGLYDFKYPRGLSFKQYPYLSEVNWKDKKNIKKYFSIESGKILYPDEASQYTINDVTSVIYVGHGEPTDVFNFHNVVHQLIKDPKASYDALVGFATYEPDTIVRTLNTAKKTNEQWYSAALSQAQIKRYFDYNFNLNSISLITPILRSLNIENPNFYLSKYALQVLYDMAVTEPMIFSKYFLRMSFEWSGTGRYKKGSIGSIASRSEIIKSLLINGLIEENRESKKICLSDRGYAFLEKLHPDSKDLDLPFRIDKWMQNGESSKPNIDLYINTFFGKIKRYSAR